MLEFRQPEFYTAILHRIFNDKSSLKGELMHLGKYLNITMVALGCCVKEFTLGCGGEFTGRSNMCESAYSP